jgi:hypothetical protein
MSNAAFKWALACRCGSSSAKAVLLVMADAANDKERTSMTGQKWPPLHAWMSQAALAECTELDRKTIGPALARLESIGLIERAGSEGSTRQIPVYLLRVKEPESGGLAEPPKQPESGRVSGDQAPAESTPVLDAKDPVFPGEGSRFSRESTPKTGYGTQRKPSGTQGNPKKKRARAPGFDAATIALPPWLDPKAWASWVADRKDRRKAITRLAAERQLATLDALRKEGHEPAAVIAKSIECGWAGLFALAPNDRRRGQAGGLSPHSGFGGRDYSDGVTDDGRIL